MSTKSQEGPVDGSRRKAPPGYPAAGIPGWVASLVHEFGFQSAEAAFHRFFHHISIDLLDEAFYELKENAAAGVDGLTWQDYEQNLERQDVFGH